MGRFKDKRKKVRGGRKRWRPVTKGDVFHFRQTPHAWTVYPFETWEEYKNIHRANRPYNSNVNDLEGTALVIDVYHVKGKIRHPGHPGDLPPLWASDIIELLAGGRMYWMYYDHLSGMYGRAEVERIS